jgi:hypothetical protein
MLMVAFRVPIPGYFLLARLFIGMPDNDNKSTRSEGFYEGYDVVRAP